MEYRLNECALLHLDAGQDRNGNARRAFALMHGPSGQIIAYADYGQQTNAGYALQEILYAFRHGASSDALMHELILRSNGERVRVAPSYRTHLRGKEVRAAVESKIHGRPILTI